MQHKSPPVEWIYIAVEWYIVSWCYMSSSSGDTTLDKELRAFDDMQAEDNYEGKYKLPNKRVAQAEMNDRLRWTEHWSDIMEESVEDKNKLLKLIKKYSFINKR